MTIEEAIKTALQYENRVVGVSVEIEERHKAIVQAEIDAVSGSGFWFDMPEFNLEAG